MKLVSSLQKDYQQLWKHIIRPPRTSYAESRLGAAVFEYQGTAVQRKDFCLTNSRGFEFTCSLWLPTKAARSHCVVYLHGNSSNRLEGMEYLLKLIAEGLALCTFDFSGCGNAEGEYVSLGLHEQQDLQLVIAHLAVYPRIDKIGLWGRSMGAVTSLLFLAGNNAISAAVFDSPFKSFKGLVEDMSSKTTKVPGIILSAALRLIDRTVQEKAKFSLFSLDPLKTAAPLLHIPAFFIVGIQDEVIPIQHTSDLFEAYAGDDKIIKMVNGGHNDTRPDLIVQLAIQFLKSRLEDSPITPENSLRVHQPHSSTEELSIRETQGFKQKPEHLPQDSSSKLTQDLSFKEYQKLEEAVNKGQFSWSNLFSGFYRTRKGEKESQEEEKEGQAERKESRAEGKESRAEGKESQAEGKEVLLKQQKQTKQPNKQGKQQLQKAATAEKTRQGEGKEAARKRKKKQREQIQKAEFEATLEQKVREYSYCYL